MAKKEPQDRKPKLSLTIKRPTKGVELCLDLEKRAEWEALEVKREELRKSPGTDQRMTGGPLTEVAREITALEQEMRDATVVFTLRALPRKEWSDAKTAHPPRKDDESDKVLGFNEATIFDDIIPASIEKVVGPDGEEVDWSYEQWEPLADEMTTLQYQDFKNAVFALNVGEAAARLPKSLGASLVMSRSGAN